MSWRRKWTLAALALLLTTGLASAPFAIFQTSSGAPSCADAPPAVAAGFGFNTCVFFDSMTSLSSVDVNMTNAAPNTGLNWYTEEPGGFSSYAAVISGTNMTASTIYNGTIIPGQTVGYGGDTCAPSPGTKIVSQTSGTTGSSGVYVVSISQSCTGTVASSFAQSPSYLSASASGLTISNVSQATDNFGIATVAYINDANVAMDGKAVYRGTTFRMSKGFLVRAYYSWDNSLAPDTSVHGLTNLRWPAWWGTSQWGVPNNGASSYEYVESDICDCFPVNMSTNLNNFVYDEGISSGSPVTYASNNFGSGGDYTNICNPVFDGSTFHTIDFLWVPSTLNSGVGLFAYLVDEDTCPGNAVFNGTLSGVDGNILIVNSITAGSLKIGSYIACGGCANHTKITSGSGTIWGVNNGANGVANVTMVASDQNNCAYYLSPGAAGCQTQGYAGAYSIAETNDQGFALIISSACTNYWSDPTMPPTTTSTACNGATGSWPLHVKNVQVWCIDMTCKRVKN
ncbi:MAG TPA: hypothetical protein VMS08_03545 [Candidatus Saccharimonadia bacterium]|nr:hypothetical protein [Candidatus Saccharimonadia bacterium]